jgi:hypothetical protein
MRRLGRSAGSPWLRLSQARPGPRRGRCRHRKRSDAPVRWKHCCFPDCGVAPLSPRRLTDYFDSTHLCSAARSRPGWFCFPRSAGGRPAAHPATCVRHRGGWHSAARSIPQTPAIEFYNFQVASRTHRNVLPAFGVGRQRSLEGGKRIFRGGPLGGSGHGFYCQWLLIFAVFALPRRFSRISGRRVGISVKRRYTDRVVPAPIPIRGIRTTRSGGLLCFFRPTSPRFSS